MLSPVLFLHNTLTSRAIYDDVIPRLPAFDAHALDFRAHGSRVHQNERFGAAQLVADVQEYVNGRGIDRFSVVGSSIGAAVAIMLARAWPARVDKLILTGVTLKEATVGDALAATFNAAVLRYAGPISAFVSGAEKQLFAGPMPAKWRDHFARLPGKSIAAALRCWRDRPDLSAPLPERPTLFIAGEKDISAPPKLAETAARKMPHASFVLLENAAHMAPAEQPERFAELVEAFLREGFNAQ